MWPPKGLREGFSLQILWLLQAARAGEVAGCSRKAPLLVLTALTLISLPSTVRCNLWTATLHRGYDLAVLVPGFLTQRT